uniref:Uncharacterized protein n=1 Tax=Magallana gigas TaxID=29159 RepID=A0A8W8I387_MAGGI
MPILSEVLLHTLVIAWGKLQKGCRDEAATPIPLMHYQELEALWNADRDDRVKDITRQTPTFQSCKSVLYRSRSGKTMPTTPEEINLQDPDRWEIIID